MLSKADIEKIIIDLNAGNGASEKIKALQNAAEAQSDTSVKPEYRAPQIGKTSVFITSTKGVDKTFSHKNYSESKGDTYAALPNVSDKFRAAAGLYWTDKIFQLETDSNTKNDLSYMREVDSTIKNHLPLKMHFRTLSAAQEDEMGRTVEWVLLESNFVYLGSAHDGAWDGNKFKNFIVKAFDDTTAQPQSDYTMSVVQLAAKHEIEEQYGDATFSYADIHGDYNYLDSRYELAIGRRQNNESRNAFKTPTLPNMYVFFAYQESEDPNPTFKKLLSLGNQIDLTNHQDMLNGQQANEQIRATPSEKYFSAWTDSYGGAVSSGAINQLADSFKNIMFSAADIATLMRYETYKESFPMWMHVEFTTDQMTEFAQTLKNSQLMGLLQSKLCDAIKNNQLPVEQMFEAKTVPLQTTTAQNVMATESEPMQKLVYQNSTRRIFDLTNWVDGFADSAAGDSKNVGLDTLYSTFLGTYKISEAISNDPKYDFYKSLMAIILKGRIKKLLRKHARTAQEVFEGKPAYHETVLYRVSKYLGPNTSGEPIQNYYVPNSNELDVFRYIDTQVKYDTQYTYEITAYELAVSTRYRYEDLMTKVQYGKWAAVKLVSEPSLRLIEVPLYVHTNRVLDNPPIHPEVEFVPFKGINNRIKILVNSGIGRYDIPYEIIESDEQAQVDKHKRVQNKLDTDETLMYETDDYPAFFEVRRMKEKPKSFADFAGKRIKFESTTLKGSDIISSGMGIIDKIKPNQKYYYCIRAIDNHGHISYPSPIYEVEMVDDTGSIYPIVKICEFAPKFKSQPSIGGRRYIHIQPTMPQMIVNEEASGLVEARTVENLERLKLSVSEEPLWGKKLKIRLTSKSTGRKIDFNVSFEHEHLKLKNRE